MAGLAIVISLALKLVSRLWPKTWERSVTVLKTLNPIAGTFPDRAIKNIVFILLVSIASLWAGHYQSASEVQDWHNLVVTQRIDNRRFEFCCNSDGNRFQLTFCPGVKQQIFDQANPIPGATVVQLKYLTRSNCQDLTGENFGFILARKDGQIIR